MAITIPASYTAISEMDFAPVLDLLRKIRTDIAAAAPRELEDLFQGYNFAVAAFMQRSFSMAWLDAPLSWTDGAFDANNQLKWRQPYSIGVVKCEYRFECKTSAASGAEIRVQGADAAWQTVAIPFAAGAWQMATVQGVDVSAAWPGTPEYFSPALQARTLSSGQVDIRSMGVRERVLTTIPVAGINPADPEPGYSDPTYGLESLAGGSQADEPLSADLMFELFNGLSTIHHRRARTQGLVILPNGQGVHPNTRWTSTEADYPVSKTSQSASCVGRFSIKGPSPIKDVALRLQVEGASDGVKQGGLFVHVGPFGRVVEVEQTWTALESAWTWKQFDTPKMPAARLGFAGRFGVDVRFFIRDDLKVRNVAMYAVSV